ncbi:WD40/YVTN repeat-like-containing domain superfamily [Sesbania bispinosa]|nr:WD40/YVTN repeat-like-containing domain superfamily [Sesbania bispinosa]
MFISEHAPEVRMVKWCNDQAIFLCGQEVHSVRIPDTSRTQKIWLHHSHPRHDYNQLHNSPSGRRLLIHSNAGCFNVLSSSLGDIGYAQGPKGQRCNCKPRAG